MPSCAPSNAEVADFLTRLSELMQLNGDDAFRIRALANGARLIDELDVDVVEMSQQDTLTEIEGIGKGIAELVAEFIDRGTSGTHEELTRTVPEGLLDLLRLPGMGHKKVMAVHEALRITSVEELEAACGNGELNALPGFGGKTSQRLLDSISRSRERVGGFLLVNALAEATQLCDALRQHPATIRIEIAGSIRRFRETVKDIDLVASSEQPTELSDAFAVLPSVSEVLLQGPTKATVRLASGMQADLRVVSDEEYPLLLHHLTGSKDHNVNMRSRARAMGLRLNEYGLTRGDEKLPCAEEGEIFAHLGLAYIPPELREGLGEVAAAESGELPNLIAAGDIRGMLHVHTDYSDGAHSLREVAEAVRRRGYGYLGICDHSKSAGYVFGLKEADVEEQHAEIDALNEEFDDFHIFKGIEVDILKDGSLDYPDEVLDRFDFTVISIHAPLIMDEAAMTERVIRAMEHPRATILAHPIGRLLLERDGFAIDIDEILKAAAASGTAIELNSHPNRLDLDWRHLKKARELGVAIAINTDAHRLGDLDNITLGIGVGRKGWLRREDVINTLDRFELQAFFQQRRGDLP